MFGFRRHHRLAAWLTLAAMVMAWLAPGVSRAVAFANGDAVPFGELCSVRDLPGRGTGEAPSTPAAHGLDACMLCTLAADTPPLLPVVVGVIDPAALSQSVPRLFLLARRTPHVWLAAQPRAPPFSS